MNFLVAVPIVVAMGIGFALGGCRCGRLQKGIELMVEKERVPMFLEKLAARLAELGFRPGNNANEHLQGGRSGVPVDATQFTHANTLKQLSVVIQVDGTGNCQASLGLGYLNPIVMDTGESAYRDAVLNYVSSQSDSMSVVPNRSFFAFTSLVGGLFAWISLVVLRALHYQPLKDVMIPNTMAFLVIGVLAVIGIVRKPRELTGLWLAIIGIVSSAVALGVVVLN